MRAAPKYYPVREREAIERRQPIHLEPALPSIFSLEAATYHRSPATGVFHVTNGYTNRIGAGRDAWGRWVPWNQSALPVGFKELAHKWNPAVWTSRPFRPDGTVGALTHPRQAGYFHWLFDVLPRYALLEAIAPELDWLYIDQAQEFQRRSWARLGVKTKIIDASMYKDIHAADIFIPTAPSTSGVVPSWVCNWLRTRLGTQARTARRSLRLYVSRSIAGNGTISNEEAVRACVAQHGFTTLHSEHLSMEDQIDLFAQAEVVLGPHGAGLSNVIFANPKCVVVELFADNYINVCYWTLCCQLGLRYAFMMAPGMAGKGGPGRPDLVVDVSKLNRLLDHLSVPTNSQSAAKSCPASS